MPPTDSKPICRVCDTPFVPGNPVCPKCDSPRKAPEQKMAEVFRRGKWRDKLKTEAELQERRRRAKRIVSRLVDLPTL